tara:strand:- start:69 stop:503 length:435 start_codon:yes stop_codon:yes gene_type:complete
MEFKLNASVFKNTPEDQKRLYGDKYDPNKNYPAFTGTLPIPKSQILSLVEHLQYAMRTELKHDEYLGEEIIPIKVSGWQKESKSGKKFLSLQYTPDYKTLMAAQEAKEASELAAPAPTAQHAAASLAKSTDGTVVFQAQQEDIF